MSHYRPTVLHADPDDGAAADVEDALNGTADRVKVVRARRYGEGVEHVEDGGIDCVIAELSFPDGSGMELLATLRAREPDLPFIIYTDVGDEATASAAIGAGVSDYVRKDDPDGGERLARGVERAIAGAANPDRYTETIRRLHDVIADREATFEEKVTSLLRLGKGLLDVETALYTRIKGDAQHVEVAVDDRGSLEKGDIVPAGTTICEHILDAERTVQLPDSTAVADHDEDGELEETGIGCYVGAPLLIEDRIDGALCLYDRRPREKPFREWDTMLVDLMAQWIGYELERHRADAEVARERDRLETFASMVSHDLRNPLNIASGHIALVQERYEDDSLHRAARALDRMNELIEDALSFARLGSAVVDRESVDLAAIAREAWSTVETADATLVIEDPGVVAADSSRVRTLLENLFRNAVEHGGPAVTVTVERTDHGFAVADDGPGIDEGQRERVFDLGYSTSEAGTGFGLGIVAQVAEAHGWEVGVNESVDGGARFEFDGVSHVLGTSTRA
ncbi:hybrid sensor histidine kinase/response regulator [Halorubrum vacuolatum]|uniref:histidine kinase n=1 Tax=Halorubrum vacuolatum TaxID=63740 RepID=A0A238UNJ1_HALVU|nr:ATP-binding protein [Halorubrum vacuolatum]SNR23167.1 GAF domain-containing protein [Halorubrum vacuolatum]